MKTICLALLALIAVTVIPSAIADNSDECSQRTESPVPGCGRE